MTISFQCPGCGCSISTDDHHAGRTATCPKCEMAISVPSHLDEDASEAESSSGELPESPLEQQTESTEGVDNNTAESNTFIRLLTAPTQDSEWVKKCLTIGVVSLIPLLGQSVFLGWQRQVFKARQRGDTANLPVLNFSSQLQDGIAPFVSLLIHGALPAILWCMIVLGSLLVGMVSNSIQQLVAVTGLAVVVVLQLVILVLAPEILRRAFTKGEMFSFLHIGELFRSVKSGGKRYAVLFCGFLVSMGLISGSGIPVCCVGVLLSAPFAGAANAAFLAAYATNEVTPRSRRKRQPT